MINTILLVIICVLLVVVEFTEMKRERATPQNEGGKMEDRTVRDNINKYLDEMDTDELAIVTRFCKMIRNTKEITVAKVTALIVENNKMKQI